MLFLSVLCSPIHVLTVLVVLGKTSPKHMVLSSQHSIFQLLVESPSYICSRRRCGIGGRTTAALSLPEARLLPLQTKEQGPSQGSPALLPRPESNHPRIVMHVLDPMSHAVIITRDITWLAFTPSPSSEQ